MNFLSRIRTQAVSWWQDTPLPPDVPEANAVFQAWHDFDTLSQRWNTVNSTPTTATPAYSPERTRETSQPLALITWNVDFSSPLPKLRMSAILSRILDLSQSVDIIFLQEVSQPALLFLLGDPRIRGHWFSSEADAASFEKQSFTNMTLLSKRRFGPGKVALGAIWRSKYPTRFGRNALCCDIFVPSAGSTTPTRVRLINVHLDSLPMQPSKRPRQLAIVSSLLRSAGHGLVAGDFNPVLPEDRTLVRDNGLVDAWVELYPGEEGFTWGVDGKEPFPPNRMDKVALLGLEAEDMEVLHPGLATGKQAMLGQLSTGKSELDEDADMAVPWSDHAGLLCFFQQVFLSGPGP